MSDSHDTHHVNYFYIFLALCGFTALSCVFDVVDIKGQRVMGMNGTVLLIFLVLAVATAKALCVMMYFMHLKFEGNWKYVLLAPTVVLAIGLPLALFPDVGRHYYTEDPQYGTRFEAAHDISPGHFSEQLTEPAEH